jgi:hypothetical protein
MRWTRRNTRQQLCCIKQTSMDLTTKAPELADVGEGVPSGTIYKSVKKVKEREQPTRENAPNLLAAARTVWDNASNAAKKLNAICPPAMKRFKYENKSKKLRLRCHIMQHPHHAPCNHSVKRATTQLSPGKGFAEESLHGGVVEQDTTQHSKVPDVVAASNVVESTG